MTGGRVLVAASGLRKAFAGAQALGGLSFELRTGEVHALVGENGAGKSTFIRILTGAETADGGELAIDGHVVASLTPATARALGIAAIHQHAALFGHLTVAENIGLALEGGSPLSRVDWGTRAARARALLEQIGAAIDPFRLVESLSLPEQQLVEIAKAVGAEARILLMDEPTASLTAREVDTLFGVVARLRERGVGMIYISHRLEEIRRVADRVTVIRDGVTVASSLPPDVEHGELVKLMVGRSVAQSDVPVPSGALSSVPILELRHVSSRAARVRDVSFTVHRGEIVGVAGLVGSGRTELAEALFGLRPIDEGELRWDGRPVRFETPSQAVTAGLAYVPEDRRRHGVLADMSVAANTSLASLTKLARHGLIDRGAEAALAGRFVERFSIKTSSLAAPVGTLSGGNQQKVALARWLATDPSLIILDEPTQGVDVGAKADIHALVRELARDGLAVLLISSELPEVMALSTRIVVMKRGRVTGVLDRAKATEEAVADLAITHTGPTVVEEPRS